jgi:hypothetical protein
MISDFDLTSRLTSRKNWACKKLKHGLAHLAQQNNTHKSHKHPPKHVKQHTHNATAHLIAIISTHDYVGKLASATTWPESMPVNKNEASTDH